MFQTKIISSDKNQSLNNQRSTTGCKHIKISKIEFVAKSQFIHPVISEVQYEEL